MTLLTLSLAQPAWRSRSLSTSCALAWLLACVQVLTVTLSDRDSQCEVPDSGMVQLIIQDNLRVNYAAGKLLSFGQWEPPMDLSCALGPCSAHLQKQRCC